MHLPHSITKCLTGAYLSAVSKVNVNVTVSDGSGGEGSGNGVSNVERKGDGHQEKPVCYAGIVMVYISLCKQAGDL